MTADNQIPETAAERKRINCAKGGFARARVLSPERRREIGCIGARERKRISELRRRDFLVYTRAVAELKRVEAEIVVLSRRLTELRAIIGSI